MNEVAGYCRHVEDCLTRANGGHLVRIVGPGFELVRSWAEQGIPLRIVFRGIELKVERHRTGQSKRPLRIEFCEGDVLAVYEHWRRAVGLDTRANSDDVPADEPAAAESAPPAAERKRPSIARQLDRALDRLSRTAGRLDLPDRLRDGIGDIASAVAEAREASRTARGEERQQLTERLAVLDREIVALARSAAADDLLDAARRDAEQDLAAFRGRLRQDGWQRALDATVDQLLRERLGLPTLNV